MARHRSFSFEFKQQVVSDFLEGRVGMREMAASTVFHGI